MLSRQEEEKRQNIFGRNEDVQINPNSIQPDVVYGEVSYAQNDCRMKKKEDKKDKKHSRNNSDVQESSDRKTDDIFKTVQSRTLPKSEKSLFEMQSRNRNPEFYEEKSELVSDVKVSEPYELLYADKKSLRMQSSRYEAQNFRDRSYELIYCPQKVNDVQFAQNRTLDGQFAQNRTLDGQKKHEKKSKLTRQHSLNSSDKKDKIFNRGDSPEKFWLDSLRRSDKVSDKSSSKVKLKSATQYTPMSLPLTPDSKGKLNPKFAFELNLDEKSGKSGLFKRGFFTKQTGADEKKEKTLLGSPRLHRALFRKHNTPEADWTSEAPQVSDSMIL